MIGKDTQQEIQVRLQANINNAKTAMADLNATALAVREHALRLVFAAQIAGKVWSTQQFTVALRKAKDAGWLSGLYPASLTAVEPISPINEYIGQGTLSKSFIGRDMQGRFPTTVQAVRTLSPLERYIPVRNMGGLFPTTLDATTPISVIDDYIGQGVANKGAAEMNGLRGLGDMFGGDNSGFSLSSGSGSDTYGLGTYESSSSSSSSGSGGFSDALMTGLGKVGEQLVGKIPDLLGAAGNAYIQAQLMDSIAKQNGTSVANVTPAQVQNYAASNSQQVMQMMQMMQAQLAAQAKEKAGLSTGAMVAIGGGVAILLGGLAYLLLRKKKGASASTAAAPAATASAA